jgi:hypothetical protein
MPRVELNVVGLIPQLRSCTDVSNHTRNGKAVGEQAKFRPA